MAFKFDFGRLLSEKARSEVEADRVELDRLHKLPDVWLANALLKLARQARQVLSDKLGYPTGCGYENALVWSVIPDLAQRLAPMLRSELTGNEGRDAWVNSKSGEDYRDLVAICLSNSNLFSWAHRLEYEGKDTSSLRISVISPLTAIRWRWL